MLNVLPYEQLVRTALAHGDLGGSSTAPITSAVAKEAPAVFSLYFWGQRVSNGSAQNEHLTVAQHYGITGVSMRDVVLDAIAAHREPYPEPVNVTLPGDETHPNAAVHQHLGDILSLHIAGKFQRWAAMRAGGLGTDEAAAALGANIGRAPAEVAVSPATGATTDVGFMSVPPPMSPALAALNLKTERFSCAVVGFPRVGIAPVLLAGSSGWETFNHFDNTFTPKGREQQCMQAVRPTARAIIQGECNLTYQFRQFQPYSYNA